MRIRIAALLPLIVAGCGEDGTLDSRRSDTISPGAILGLAVERTADDSVTLHWTAPGDDAYAGRASRYELRYGSAAVTETTWESASTHPGLPAPKTSGSAERHDVGGLGPGRWYFALKTADEDANWSAISNAVFAELGDTIPPGNVTDLTVFGFDRTSVTLAWTAPGDDDLQGRAEAHHLRYSEQSILESTWETATSVEGAPEPAEPGAREQFTIDGLDTDRVYYFALRTMDDGGNLSTLSNVVSATTIGDMVPPADVTDLEVVLEAGRSVSLRWTAPGDNGAVGQAAEYDLRHSSVPIDESTWASAIPVPGLAKPDPAGETETFTVTGLTLDAGYYFALRTADGAGNVSGVSNVIMAATTSLVILTSSPAGRSVSSPDWEPNGHRIAFSASWGERSQIHTVDANDGGLVQITAGQEHFTTPAWSPDASVLSCGVIRFEDSRQGIVIVGLRPGSVPTPIVTHAFGVIVQRPTWSPKGDRIAYQVSEISSSTGEIFVVERFGGTPEPIVSDGSSIFGLDWSPDGGLIVYSSKVAGSYDLWIVAASGGTPVQLTHDSTDESQPAWSRDGSRIAFESNSDGGRNLWVMPATGGVPTQITFGSDDKRAPCWSPAGDALAFELRLEDRTSDVAIVYLP